MDFAYLFYLTGHALLLGAWLYTTVDCLRRQRSYRWLAATAFGPLTLYVTTLAYMVNFQLLPALGLKSVSESVGNAAQLRSLERRAAEEPIPARVFELASAYFAERRWQDCLRTLGSLLDEHPDHLRGFYEAGVSLLRLGRIGGALTMLSHVVEESPKFDQGTALVRLAEAHEAAGDRAATEAALRRLWSFMAHPEGAVRYARFLAARDARAEAKEVLTLLLETRDRDRATPEERRWLDDAAALRKSLK